MTMLYTIRTMYTVQYVYILIYILGKQIWLCGLFYTPDNVQN